MHTRTRKHNNASRWSLKTQNSPRLTSFLSRMARASMHQGTRKPEAGNQEFSLDPSHTHMQGCFCLRAPMPERATVVFPDPNAAHSHSRGVRGWASMAPRQAPLEKVVLLTLPEDDTARRRQEILLATAHKRIIHTPTGERPHLCADTCMGQSCETTASRVKCDAEGRNPQIAEISIMGSYEDDGNIYKRSLSRSNTKHPMRLHEEQPTRLTQSLISVRALVGSKVLDRSL